jgi:heat shock protein HslJ
MRRPLGREFEKECLMKRISVAILATVFASCLAQTAQAKSKAAPKPEAEQKPSEATLPRYKPFPHNQIFLLKDINGKTPPVEMWIRIDSTMRGSGFSGCKSWSTVFIVGADRLGPKAMPAMTDKKCDPPLQALEQEYWGLLMSGPYWDTQGSELILKGIKGGQMRFMRSL